MLFLFTPCATEAAEGTKQQILHHVRARQSKPLRRP